MTRSAATISNCRFVGNRGIGAGVSATDQSSLGITGCVFSNNISSGGTVYSLSSYVTLEDCLLANNQSTSSGGALFSAASTNQVIHCTIVENKADSTGGGILVQQGRCDVLNSILWNNSASPVY